MKNCQPNYLLQLNSTTTETSVCFRLYLQKYISYLLYRWKCSGFNNLVHLFLLVLYGGQQALHIHLPVIVVLLPSLVHFCNLHQNWLPYINRTAGK